MYTLLSERGMDPGAMTQAARAMSVFHVSPPVFFSSGEDSAYWRRGDAVIEGLGQVTGREIF